MNMILKISYSKMQKLIFGGHGTPYNITTQHSKSVTLHIIGTTHTGTDSFSMFTE